MLQITSATTLAILAPAASFTNCLGQALRGARPLAVCQLLVSVRTQTGGCLLLPPQQLQPCRQASDDSVRSSFDAYGFPPADYQQQQYQQQFAMGAEAMDSEGAAHGVEAEAVSAAAAVDRAKVASMLDALALQQPLFMSSKYVKIADLNR